MHTQLPTPAPQRSIINCWMRTQMTGIAQIYFQSNPLFGVAFLLCLYLTGPELALGCLLGVCSASAAAWAAGYPAAERREGQYGFNAALSGVGLCSFYQLDGALLAWVVLGGVLTALITHCARHVKLPVLTFPFVLVMWLAVVAGPHLGLRFDSDPTSNCSLSPLSYAFCAMGQVSFIDVAPLGMLLWSAMAHGRWKQSAWMLGGALMAWSVATLGAHLWPDSGIAAQATGMGANAVLVMLALCVHQRAWPLRLFGALLSMVLCIGFGAISLQYFTLPFILASWMMLSISVPCRDN